MGEIIELIVKNIVIYAAVAGAVALASKPSRKAIDYEIDSFAVDFPLSLKIIITIGMLFFLLLTVVNYGSIFFGWEIIGQGWGVFTSVMFTSIFILELVCFAAVVVWRLEVKGDTVKYRNYIGIVKKYSVSDIDRVEEKKDGSIRVFSNGRRIFSIDRVFALGGAYFELWSREHGIEIQRYPKKN